MIKLEEDVLERQDNEDEDTGKLTSEDSREFDSDGLLMHTAALSI